MEHIDQYDLHQRPRKRDGSNTENFDSDDSYGQPRINNLNNSTETSSLMGPILILVSLVLGCILYSNFWNSPVTCDMSKAENREFDRYYGLTGVKNHFTTPAADECDSNIIFKAALPQAILKSDHSASSFLTLANYGTGKTLVRCEYTQSLTSRNYLKVLVLNKQLGEYLERFVSKNSEIETDCKNSNCLHGWSVNEFTQLLLSLLVTEFVHFTRQNLIKIHSISIEEKMKLITILCYYYNGVGTSELEHFINFLLDKSGPSMYHAYKAVVQIQERNVAVDKPLLTHFKEDLKKFSALKQDYERLHLLLAITEGEGFQHQAIVTSMFGNMLNDLTHFSLHIKNRLNKIPVFIIDGIDENKYFFQGNAVNKASMETFCRSSVSEHILSKVMANNFYLSIFYPKLDGINIEDAIVRKDKFPVYKIEWNTKSLLNYADYVLQEMNRNASSTRCKAFTDFKTLVNYSNKRIADIINKIPTPRALHYFMTELITDMNSDASDATSPFVATFENVHNAYEKAYEHFNRFIRVTE